MNGGSHSHECWVNGGSSATHHSCEMREYTSIVLRKYLIIFLPLRALFNISFFVFMFLLMFLLKVVKKIDFHLLFTL